MNRKLDLIWLRIREYFKHPAEDIRQEEQIVPGRIYSNFGYICKAVPMTSREKTYLERHADDGALPVELLRDHGDRAQTVGELEQYRLIPGLPKADLPARCDLCDFYRKSIPCPIYNTLKDGSVVCDTNRYIIIKNQK